MMDTAPRQPHRPLFWPDFILDLQEFLHDIPDEIYIVGGAVRDALLHRPLHDIDLATPQDAVKLARKIANHFNGDIFVLDAERDVGRVLLDLPDGRLTLDVARFRGSSLLDDLQDRDFTLNAMSVDLHGDLSLLVDPLNGETDVKHKLLRRCGDHALSDDPIRALRAVRQSTQLGMHIESETLKDVRHVVPEFAAVSPERLRDEWFKVLDLQRTAAALRVANSLGLVDTILPEAQALQAAPDTILPGVNVWQHTLTVIENLAGILNSIHYTRTDQTAASFGMGMIVIQLDRYRTSLIQHLGKLWPNERTHRALMMLGALLHDAGRVDGSKSSEKQSAELAAARADALRLSVPERDYLVTLIRQQQLPLMLSDTTPLSLYQFWKQTGEVGVDICLL